MTKVDFIELMVTIMATTTSWKHVFHVVNVSSVETNSDMISIDVKWE